MKDLSNAPSRMKSLKGKCSPATKDEMNEICVPRQCSSLNCEGLRHLQPLHTIMGYETLLYARQVPSTNKMTIASGKIHQSNHIKPTTPKKRGNLAGEAHYTPNSTPLKNVVKFNRLAVY